MATPTMTNTTANTGKPSASNIAGQKNTGPSQLTIL